MPRDLPDQAAGLNAVPEARTWHRALALLAAVWAGSIALFASDWAAMVDQWWNISTYNHILLIPAIVGWLAWQRRMELLKRAPQASRWGLLAVAGALLIWLLGAVSGVSLLRQAGAVAVLPSTYLLLLGPRALAVQLFPLAYLGFLIPFGDELVPPLQMVTAMITIALVRVSDIPAAIDGVFIDTPAGLFEVAEACSGVKFLIAMIALGVLVSNLCYRSWHRRFGFMALCVIVPILANGLRAFGIVYAAQFIGAERATGVDHLIYGWVFFAIVIAAVLALGWRFFDRGIDDPMIDPVRLAASPLLARLDRAVLPTSAALALLLASLGLTQFWARQAEALTAPIPAQIFLPDVAGWQRVDFAPQAPWQPRAAGADHRLLGSYADPRGRRIDVFVALYAAQREGTEASGFGEGALRPDSGWSWEKTGPAIGSGQSEWLRGPAGIGRLAYTWYRSGTLTTGSSARLKLATIGDRLLLRAQPTMTLIISTENRPGGDPESDLAAFRQSIAPLDQWMDRIAALR